MGATQIATGCGDARSGVFSGFLRDEVGVNLLQRGHLRAERGELARLQPRVVIGDYVWMVQAFQEPDLCDVSEAAATTHTTEAPYLAQDVEQVRVRLADCDFLHGEVTKGVSVQHVLLSERGDPRFAPDQASKGRGNHAPGRGILSRLRPYRACPLP